MSVTTKAVEALFEVTSGNTSSIRTEAIGKTVEDWQTAQIVKAAAIGAGTAAIPIAGYVTLPADLAALMRIMHRSAVGTCAIELGDVDEETFSTVLGVWSGAIILDNQLASDIHNQIAAQIAAHSAPAIGGKAGLKLAIKAFNLCAHTLVAKKLAPKVATKVATKMTAKLAAKATTRWIPFISAAVGAGANWYIVNGINNSSNEYTKFMKQFT